MDTAIQLGELLVAVGWFWTAQPDRHVLEHNPTATVGVLPKNQLLLFEYGEWDRSDLEWCQRNPQTFDFVRKHSAEFYIYPESLKVRKIPCVSLLVGFRWRHDSRRLPWRRGS